MAAGSRIAVIANPQAAGGRIGQRWSEIHEHLEATLGPIEAHLTAGPGSATTLARRALEDGVGHVLALGGDGTVNEVVNGFLEDEGPVAPEARLTPLLAGTGSDLIRTFGIPRSLEAQIDRLPEATDRPIDVGKLTYTDEDGGRGVRYFDNVASFGLSGLVDRLVARARASRLAGGSVAFFLATVHAMLAYDSPRVRLQVDQAYDRTLAINTVAVCNGRYFGGGMAVAPEAEADDGLFDVAVLGAVSLPRMLAAANTIYKGQHLTLERNHLVRGRRVQANPAGSTPVLLDVDGEAIGRLPATFEIVPKAITLRI